MGSALDLTIADTNAVRWLPGGGLAVEVPTVIRSAGTATKLNTALQASQAVTIEAPYTLNQSGPARIAALSLDGYPDGGNLMLGAG